MDPKSRPNHAEYIRILRRMTPEQRLNKAFELSETSRKLFIRGLRERYPDIMEEQIKQIIMNLLQEKTQQEWLVSQRANRNW